MAQAKNSKASAKTKLQITTASLRQWNKWLAAVYVLEGILILVLSAVKTYPVQLSFLTTDSLASGKGSPVFVPAMRHIFEVNPAIIIALIFFLAAVALASSASWYRRRYETELAVGINRVRWVEQGVTAGLMLVVVGLVVGMTDLASLLMVVGLVLIANLLGLVMEIQHLLSSRRPTSWYGYVVSLISGLLAWAVIGLYLIANAIYGDTHVPVFAYWLCGILFVLSVGLAVGMYLQFARRGKWANYLYAERSYLILGLVAKTVLAWIVFAGVLKP